MYNHIEVNQKYLDPGSITDDNIAYNDARNLQ